MRCCWTALAFVGGVEFFIVLSSGNPRQARFFQYLNSPVPVLHKAGGRLQQNIFSESEGLGR